MGAAICGVLPLVSSVVYDSAVAGLVPAAFAVLIVWLWFGAPLLRERRGGD
jgi:hypothetical protein